MARAEAARRAVIASRPYRRLRDALLGAHTTNIWVTREDLARRHLRGSGIEIGALDRPLRVPPGVTVSRVDRADRAGLIAELGAVMRGSEMDPEAIVEVHIVDDGETLATLSGASQDFVIANHVLEHIEDPVGALKRWVEVLRPGGVLFITLPDPRFTFDGRRARTSVDHVLADHADGPAGSRFAHYEEWARIIEGLDDDGEVAARVEAFAAEDARHHFHVWELEDFLALVRALELPAELVEARAYAIEFAVLLRRG